MRPYDIGSANRSMTSAMPREGGEGSKARATPVGSRTMAPPARPIAKSSKSFTPNPSAGATPSTIPSTGSKGPNPATKLTKAHYAKGGMVDGCCTKGKTKGRMY